MNQNDDDENQLLNSSMALANMCFICMNQLESNQITLDCGHTFCIACFAEFIRQLTSQEEIDFDAFQCPSCRKSISIDMLEPVLNASLSKKCHDQMISQHRISGLHPDEIYVCCLDKICPGRFVIYKHADYFTCQICKKKFCLKCKELCHEKLSCLQNKEKIKLTTSKIRFISDMKQLNAKLCPHCFIAVEKRNGCQLMTCESKQCKGQKYFCFTCQTPLDPDMPISHYGNRDSYNGKCLVKVKNQWVDPETLYRPNDEPCPKCNSTDSRITIFEENFDGRAITCNSKKCKGAIYCMFCYKKLEGKLLDEHIINQFYCNCGL